MQVQFKSKQRGMSFISMVFFGSILACLGVIAAQVLPTVIEYQSILKATNKAAREGSTPQEVRAVFDRAQAIDDFQSIAGKDLEVTKVNDKVIVRFSYQREIHLVGPGYLTLKYEGQSK
jgi:hypothetical protein